MSISSVTSEALQLKLRQLLPSQQGFGTDLSASDTIIPIIDLTASAEGSDVRDDLQSAFAYGSITSFDAESSTATIANTAGFWRVFANVTARCSTSAPNASAEFTLTDGVSPKTLWKAEWKFTSNTNHTTESLDFLVYLDVGITLETTGISNGVYIYGCARQIADTNGTLVQPAGFSPQ